MNIGRLDKIFSFMAMVVGLSVIVLSISIRNDDNQIRKTGQKATATVVDTIVVISKPINRTYDASRDKRVWGIYEFNASDGKTYRVQAKTSGSHLGKRSIIYYNPAAPDQTYYLDSDAYGFYLGAAIGLIILIVGGVIYRRAKKFQQSKAVNHYV